MSFSSSWLCKSNILQLWTVRMEDKVLLVWIWNILWTFKWMWQVSCFGSHFQKPDKSLPSGSWYFPTPLCYFNFSHLVSRTFSPTDACLSLPWCWKDDCYTFIRAISRTGWEWKSAICRDGPRDCHTEWSQKGKNKYIISLICGI